MLSIEDYNTAQLKPINEFYELDTANIGEQEFENVLYDFCIINHSISGTDHTFVFEIRNHLWAGEHYFLKSNGEWLDVTGTYDSSTKTITVTTTESTIKLGLYLCSYRTHFNFYRTNLKVTSDVRCKVLDKSQIGNYRYYWDILELIENRTWRFYYDVDRVGVSDRLMNQYTNIYLLILLKKTDLVYDLSNVSLTVGSVNNVALNVDADYLPGGSLVGDDPLNIIVKYGDVEIKAEYDEDLNDYYFKLDLTNKINNAPVNLTIQVNEIDYVNSGTKDVTLNCDYPTASNFAELNNLIVNGINIVQLNDNIFFNGNILLNYNIYIIGNDKNIYLNDNTIYVKDNITVKIDNVLFNGGSNCLKQLENNKLVLNNCSFNNCAINDREKGSVIANTETSVTEINNCKFNECPHTIYNSGDLTVTNSEAIYTETANIDPDYSMFINSYAGDVEIKNSKFKIRIDTNDLCSNEIDMRFAQSLIGIGEEAIINGVYGSKLHENNCLPLFDNPYNNSSHIYAKYYYPEIDDCVIINPELSYEKRSACHRIIGIDWVYKNNCKINPANSNEINNIGGD